MGFLQNLAHPLQWMENTDNQSPEVTGMIKEKPITLDRQNPFLRGLGNAALGIGVGALTGDPFLAAVTAAKMGYDGYKGASANNTAYGSMMNEVDAKYNNANALNHLVNDKPDANAADLQKVYNAGYYDDYVKTYNPEFQKVRTGLNTAEVQQDRLDSGTVNFNHGYMNEASVNNVANDQIKLLQDAANKGNFNISRTYLQSLLDETQPQPQTSYTGGRQGIPVAYRSSSPALNGGINKQEWQGGQPNLYNLWNSPGYNSDAMEKLVSYSDLNPSTRNINSEIHKRDLMLPGELQKQQYDLNKPYFNPNYTPYGQLTDYQQHLIDQKQQKEIQQQQTNYNNYKYLNDAVYVLEHRTQPSPYPWDNGKLIHIQPTDEDYKALGFKGGRRQAMLELQKMKNNGWGNNPNQENNGNQPVPDMQEGTIIKNKQGKRMILRGGQWQNL